MASRRRKRKRGYPSHLRKYMFKKKRRSHRKALTKGHRSMAKRRHRRHRKHHSHRRRRRGGGHLGGGGWIPGGEDLKLFAAGAVIGVAESKAKADTGFALNKIPRPVVALGYTGGTALALWIGGKLIGGTIGRYARLGARAAATAAAYQMGKRGAAFTDLSISGDDELSGGPEMYIEDHVMGAIDPEGEMSGLPFDVAVHDAGEHT